MDPVIGLDVTKGESQVQAFLQRKKPYKKSFKFEHHLQGLHAFYQFYQEVEQFLDNLRLSSLNPPVTIMSLCSNFLRNRR